MNLGRTLACLVLMGAATSVATSVHAQVPAVPGVGTGPVAQPDREIQVASDAFTKDPTLPRWTQPAAVPETKMSGAAVVALSDSQILVGDTPVVYAHRAIKVNDATVLSSIGRVPLQFIPAYQKLVLHRLAVVRDGVALDRLPGAQVRFLQRETGLENNLYSGVVTASILIDDLRVGDTLEIAFSTIGVNPVFGPVFGGAEGWDQNLPVEERRVILNTPVARPVGWKTHGLVPKPIPAPTEKVVGGMRIVTFEEHSLSPVPAEAAVPLGFPLIRWIEFSEYMSWNAVATWAAALFVDNEAPNAERVALVAKLMQKPTTEERVVGALEVVQSQVRYFSVSLGTSSHRPTPPNTVLSRRYGDCKDKSLLLVTLLKDMGIASTPVLARLGNRIGFDDWLPTPIAFDHVIVKVDVDQATYWLDATRLGQYGRLAQMGQTHEGTEVLVASSATQGLERVGAPVRAKPVLDERTETFTMTALDGDGDLRVDQVQYGAVAEVLRVAMGALPQERIDTLVTADMEKRYPGARLVEPVRIDDDRVENRLTVRFRFTLPKPAKREGDAWRVAFRADNLQRVFVLPPDAKRRSPVAVRYPVDARYTFDATFPDDVSVAVDPATTTINDPAFVSTSTFSFVGNRSIATAEIRTLVDRIPPEALPKLRTDLDKFSRGFPSAVVIGDANIKKGGFLGIGKDDFAKTLKKRQEDIVVRTTTTIDSGRLTGSDLARAYCARGTAALSLGHGDDARRDTDKAVELDPNAPSMLSCRGNVKLGVRDYAQAAEDYSQAIVLGAELGGAYFQRGQARFQLGRYPDAIADFTKASTLDNDDRLRLYHDLWRAMAYRRMGKPLPDDLQKRATEDPRGAWPRPALALLADALPVDAIAALAAQTPGDVAQLNGTEADYFTGQYWLEHGDPAKARAAFVAARDRGVIIYTEYGASGVEIDKLDKSAR